MVLDGGAFVDGDEAVWSELLGQPKPGVLALDGREGLINKPMGISEYRLTEAIPENIKYKLPTIEELENELEKNENEG